MFLTIKRWIDKSFLPGNIRRLVKNIYWVYRRATGGIRVLPDFIIIGAQRAGTTTVYLNLGRHPCVSPALTKEVHFFDENFHKGINWYKAHFVTIFWQKIAKLAGKRLISGEASPYYLFHPLAPERVREAMPEVKLIALLRNPIDRSHSHYHHEVRLGCETLTFSEALEKEEERLKNSLNEISGGNGGSFAHKHFSYKARGAYADQLSGWFRYFPRQQFLIIKSEDMYNDAEKVFADIFRFLGLPDFRMKSLEKYNLGEYGKLDEATRNSLRGYFSKHNEKLYEMLGADFGWD